ncbi:MAG: GNAT family N-acetyltransferase [Chloroflexi bacterium]|nr:GNAT family N-acetyltransferase [Chloroflexota bacterium]
MAKAILDFRGAAVVFRPVTPEDRVMLGDYFTSLSNETRRRYGPHPFDRGTADRLCRTTDPAEVLRMIAITSGAVGERIIAYFILILGIRDDDAQRYLKLNLPLDAATDCTLAPSVADEYQSQGLGSVLMRQLIVLSRQLGRRRMVLWGGTQATNDRAIRFYHKHGFRTVGEFQEPLGFNNYDMIMDL